MNTLRDKVEEKLFIICSEDTPCRSVVINPVALEQILYSLIDQMERMDKDSTAGGMYREHLALKDYIQKEVKYLQSGILRIGQRSMRRIDKYISVIDELKNRIEVLENEVKTLNNYEYYNVNKPTSTIVVKKAKPGEVITY